MIFQIVFFHWIKYSDFAVFLTVPNLYFAKNNLWNWTHWWTLETKMREFHGKLIKLSFNLQWNLQFVWSKFKLNSISKQIFATFVFKICLKDTTGSRCRWKDWIQIKWDKRKIWFCSQFDKEKSLVSMVSRAGDEEWTRNKKTALSCCSIRCVSFNDQPRPKTLISDDITNSSH